MSFAFINLYGLDLRVVTNDGVDYVDPRPICELCHMNWGMLQTTLRMDDCLLLYGSKLLASPNLPFDERPKGSEKPSTFIRLDRLKLFLLRLDTDRVRWRGNAEQAERLLEDQIAWATALNINAPNFEIMRHDN